jgi:nucleotide-binding universal stress UspA family protein
MTTILVGVDGTHRSADAIALARDLAEAGGAEILLAEAVPYPTIALMGDGVATVVAQEVVQRAEERLAALAAPLRDAGLTIECATRPFLSGAFYLQSLAEERHVDLVVVGSTHSSRWGRVLPGSTGERLLHGAPCPVAVAPHGYADAERRQWQRIAVGFDGSAESRAALQAGVALAGGLGAKLDVIAVLDAMHFGSPALMGGPGYDRTRPDLEADARERLEAAVAALPESVQAAGWLLEGEPAEQLAEASEDRDAMVVGSRRYGPLRAVLLGGVSGRLARRAACPLIVTPRGVEAPLAGLAGLSVTGTRHER